MKRVFMFSALSAVFLYLSSEATIINIPDDYPTIQEGIDASADGDTVLVQPGTYIENINFNGHNITLGSLFLTTSDTTYIAETIIDGDSSASVVIFENGEDSTAIITGFTVENGNGTYGGGISCREDSNPIITNNAINDNCAFQGGGIHCYQSSPIISKNTIEGNFTTAEGGGIWSDNSDPVICNNTIAGNSACCGGGVFCFYSVNPVLRNNIIRGNSVIYYGGGFNFLLSSPALSNNTITENSASYGGGIFCQANSDVTIVNSIIWGNDASYNGDEIYVYNSSLNLTYSNIRTGWPGEGNIGGDPLFRDPENRDFHLMSTACGDGNDSPCIDAGNPDILDSLLHCDWGLGNLRSDMGAYGGGDSVIVGIDDQEILMPDKFILFQNYPNPFNASTVIRYALPEPADIKIEIFDILGRRVETIIDERQEAGYHHILWNGGVRSAGIYLYRLQAGDYSQTRKLVLLK